MFTQFGLFARWKYAYYMIEWVIRMWFVTGGGQGWTIVIVKSNFIEMISQAAMAEQQMLLIKMAYDWASHDWVVYQMRRFRNAGRPVLVFAIMVVASRNVDFYSQFTIDEIHLSLF